MLFQSHGHHAASEEAFGEDRFAAIAPRDARARGGGHVTRTPSPESPRLPARRELEAARKRLERRMRELSANDQLAEADRQRESAALQSALGIMDLLLARAAPAVARAPRKTRPRG